MSLLAKGAGPGKLGLVFLLLPPARPCLLHPKDPIVESRYRKWFVILLQFFFSLSLSYIYQTSFQIFKYRVSWMKKKGPSWQEEEGGDRWMMDDG